MPRTGPGTGSTPSLSGMSLSISFMASGCRDPAAHRALCILAVHSTRGVVVSGESRQHSSLYSSTLSQSLYLSPSRLPRRNAMASEARCRHSGVACSSLAGGQRIWTVVLAPVDKSQSAGSDEISNPLSMANAKSAEGSVTATGSHCGPGRSMTPRSPSCLEVGRTSRVSPSSLRSRSSPDPLSLRHQAPFSRGRGRVVLMASLRVKW